MNRLASWLGCAVCRALALTWRVEVAGAEHLERLRASQRGFIFAVWHQSLIPLVWWHRAQGVTLLISDHTDGRRLARLARGWGYRVVQGSSTRGGVRGMRGLLRALRDGHEVGLTPDGPRGPAGVVKPGTVAAARRAGAAILPVAAGVTKAWQARSWDRMRIPRPFARIRIVYAPPYHPVGSGALEDDQTDLAARLDAVYALARSAS